MRVGEEREWSFSIVGGEGVELQYRVDGEGKGRSSSSVGCGGEGVD